MVCIKLLEQDSKFWNSLGWQPETGILNMPVNLKKEYDDDAESVITDQRYQYIQKLIETTVKKPAAKMSVSDGIDSIVTNRILGIPIFVLVMWGVYYVSVTTLGTLVTDWTNDTFVAAVRDGPEAETAGASY
ncbi:MAG: hypothetical protein ACLUCE_11035 [Streptococcus sp.]|uniref:hypothetical protein n=1 Tax=Streptococcus sp. TaxID=1306 RepID=UPI003993F821